MESKENFRKFQADIAPILLHSGTQTSGNVLTMEAAELILEVFDFLLGHIFLMLRMSELLCDLVQVAQDAFQSLANAFHMRADLAQGSDFVWGHLAVLRVALLAFAPFRAFRPFGTFRPIRALRTLGSLWTVRAFRVATMLLGRALGLIKRLRARKVTAATTAWTAAIPWTGASPARRAWSALGHGAVLGAQGGFVPRLHRLFRMALARLISLVLRARRVIVRTIFRVISRRFGGS